MMRMLTDAHLASFQEAFELWDTASDGTVAARDLEKVMRFLGVPPSFEVQMMFEDPNNHDWRVSFAEFLNLVAGPPCYAVAFGDEEELMNSCATYGDGSGYLPLRDLLRAVDEHMGPADYKLPDVQLRNIYHRALDLSLLENTGGIAPEMMWSIFEKEFGAMREEQNSRSVVAADRDRNLAFATRESPGCHDASTAARLIDLTIVDLSGTQLLSQTVAADSLVQELHEHIEKVLGVHAQRQALFLAGTLISRNGATLSEAGIVDGTSLMLVVQESLKVDYRAFVRRFIETYYEQRAST